MASIATPIVGAVVTSALGALGPLVGKVASALIQAAETHLPKGSKLPAVLNGLKGFLSNLGASGAEQQTMPTDTELTSIIEGVLAKMKADGTLVVPGAAGSVAAISATASPSVSPSGGATVLRDVLDALIDKGVVK